MLKLVVGLGNPGPEYEGTRHNVGFAVLDRLAREEGLLFRPARALEGYTGSRAFTWARSEKGNALLVKPETWMNRSGDVVAPLVRTFLAPAGAPAGPTSPPAEPSAAGPSAAGLSGSARADEPVARPLECLVVYDDLDLPLGRLRIRPHGGAGGHNGMRSIIDRLGTDRFPRLRVGIGSPRTDAARHVLSRFDPREEEDVEISVAEAAEAITDWLAHGDLEQCMTRFHSRWNSGA